MAIRRIRTYPDPILRRKARPVRRIDDGIRALFADMVETLIDAEGVGLAANQVGVLKRVIALHLPEEDPYCLVNPEIIKAEGQRDVNEGCLSLPGFEGLVTRSVRVTARALDQNGSKWRVTAEELFAQVLEHEIDHTNGILYIDHLAEHERLRRIGEDEPHSHAHLHDVTYNIHASHGDDHQHPSPLSLGKEELLFAKATLSQVTPEHSMEELAYDLTDLPHSAPQVTPPPRDEKRDSPHP